MDEITKADRPQNPLDRVIVADQNGSITVTRCAVCSSKHRLAVETMFEQNHHVSTIKKYMEDNGEPLAVWRIRHHLDTHYKNMAMQAAIADYRDNLEEMMKRRRSMVDDILYSTDIAITELAKVLVLQTNGDFDKESKRAKMISDHQKTIRDNYEFIKSLNDSETKAKALEERFIRVWQIKLEKATDERERKLLVATLQDFKDKFAQLGS